MVGFGLWFQAQGVADDDTIALKPCNPVLHRSPGNPELFGQHGN
jgi:hypothetical protein